MPRKVQERNMKNLRGRELQKEEKQDEQEAQNNLQLLGAMS